jgi:hypothetical protein
MIGVVTIHTHIIIVIIIQIPQNLNFYAICVIAAFIFIFMVHTESIFVKKGDFYFIIKFYSHAMIIALFSMLCAVKLLLNKYLIFHLIFHAIFCQFLSSWMLILTIFEIL